MRRGSWQKGLDHLILISLAVLWESHRRTDRKPHQLVWMGPDRLFSNKSSAPPPLCTHNKGKHSKKKLYQKPNISPNVVKSYNALFQTVSESALGKQQHILTAPTCWQLQLHAITEPFHLQCWSAVACLTLFISHLWSVVHNSTLPAPNITAVYTGHSFQCFTLTSLFGFLNLTNH